MTALTPAREWTVAHPTCPWSRARAFVALAASCAVLPLLRPVPPPLIDLPGHIDSNRIRRALGGVPDAARARMSTTVRG